MASAIMHICVAKKVNEFLDLEEKELFLGSIAPDIMKELKEDKKKSHFIVNEDDIPNIELFLEKYKKSIKNTFDLGYLIHLYTDKLFYKEFLPIYIKENNIKSLNKESVIVDKEYMSKILYGDYTNMNIFLIDEFNLDLSLFYESFNKPISDITEIPVGKLDILIDKMGIIIANSKEKKNILLDNNKVVDFINETAYRILEFLKKQ